MNEHTRPVTRTTRALPGLFAAPRYLVQHPMVLLMQAGLLAAAAELAVEGRVRSALAFLLLLGLDATLRTVRHRAER